MLAFIEQDAALKNSLALKGGTAINLTIFDLPRLSVDIDLDFSENLAREAMLEKRKVITGRIRKYMAANGYILSGRSKSYHALDSFVYEYQNAGGMRDNLKIEINYMLRCHVLEPKRREVKLSWLEQPLTVMSVDPMEVFASKIVAFLNRAAPRDLFDLSNMLRFGLFDESEQELLQKCVVFYSAIGSEEAPASISFDSIAAITPNRIKTDLLPVLRNGTFFDVKAAQKECIEYLEHLLTLNEKEKEFLCAFRVQQYRPEILFSDSDILSRVTEHPMAIWKCKVRGHTQSNESQARPSVLAKLHSHSETCKQADDSPRPKKHRSEQER